MCRFDIVCPVRGHLVPAIATAPSSSVFEELLFRGVVFRSVETWFGSWAALVLCTTTGMAMLVMAARRGKIVPPIWTRPA